MTRRLVELAERHAMFHRGDHVGVAVSGGPDSVCLLHLLREVAWRWSLRLSVLHVDHQLRGEASRADAAFAAELAREFGFDFQLEQVSLDEGDGGIEQAARNARLNFFHRLLTSGTVTKVATGHTLSDQAETVLLRLLRGCGGTGLTGIVPVTSEGIVRPMLGIHRLEVEQWLKERGLSSRVDETNAQRDFLRNRIRLDLLPALRSSYNPRIELALSQTADLAREEEAYWAAVVESAAAESFRYVPGPAVILSVAQLRASPKALARRLVRKAIGHIRGDLRQIEFEHVEAILHIAGTTEGHGRVIVPGVDAMRSFEWLRFCAPGMDREESRVQVVPLKVPGDTILPGGRGILQTRMGQPAVVRPGESRYNEVQVESEQWARLDWETVQEPLELRFWLPGDQYQPKGKGAPEKLKQMFQDARIPLWERRFWPMIEGSQGVVWTRRFGPGARYLETSTTREVLEIREI